MGDYEDENPPRQLSPEECWAALEAAPVGRLALSVGNEVDIFPVNFLVVDGAIVILTSPGTKLLELTINDHVAFEVDEFSDTAAQSVVLKGHAERVELQHEIDELDALGREPWIRTPKFRWVRIHPETITGIAFER